MLSRSSCDLQILDAAVVEKIEEEVEKYKVLIFNNQDIDEI